MTQNTQQSTPVPCANCEKDLNLDYPEFAMAAMAGICGECEKQALEAEKSEIAQQINQSVSHEESIDLQAELIKHSESKNYFEQRQKFLEARARFYQQ